MGAYRDFDELTREALDFAVTQCGGVAPHVQELLLQAYKTLDAFPDVVPALRMLRERGAKTAILSNGTPQTLACAGLTDLLDESLSVDVLGRYKTAPEVYALACDRYGLRPEQISFQSSNRWDVAGATKFGFRAVWINRARVRDEYFDLPPGRITTTLADL